MRYYIIQIYGTLTVKKNIKFIRFFITYPTTDLIRLKVSGLSGVLAQICKLRTEDVYMKGLHVLKMSLIYLKSFSQPGVQVKQS